MKTLIVYYSRSNITKKVAESIREKLDCDVEEVKLEVNYDGPVGYARGIKDALQEKIVDLNPLEYDVEDYDRVILGTPVWASKSANPLISYIDNNKDKFKNVKILLTAGSSGFYSSIKQINNHTGVDASKTLSIRTADVKNDKYLNKLDEFLAN